MGRIILILLFPIEQALGISRPSFRLDSSSFVPPNSNLKMKYHYGLQSWVGGLKRVSRHPIQKVFSLPKPATAMLGIFLFSLGSVIIGTYQWNCHLIRETTAVPPTEKIHTIYLLTFSFHLCYEQYRPRLHSTWEQTIELQ